MFILTILIAVAVISAHVDAEYERDIKGKVAVVTGGARGIGYAITENYLKAGARNVIIVDKDQLRGLLTEKILNLKYDNRVLFIHGDVTTDLDKVWEIVFHKFECIDILVNNAGIVDERDPVTTVLTNLLAPMLWSERFYNYMRKDRGGIGGTIINIASLSGITKDPFIWNYKATKFGLLGFSFGLGHEYNYLTSGVRVFAINPGFTNTGTLRVILPEQEEMFERAQKAMPWQEPDAVGQAAVVLYETAVTGMAYTIEGGELSVSSDGIIITAEYLLKLEDKKIQHTIKL